MSGLFLFLISSHILVVISAESFDSANKTSTSSSQECVPLTISSCKKLGYDSVRFPNILDQNNQEEASKDVAQYGPLIAIGCHPKTALLICSAYAPACTESGKPNPPCRETCELVKKGCITLIKMFGHNWPEPLTCEKFPAKAAFPTCIS